MQEEGVHAREEVVFVGAAKGNNADFTFFAQQHQGCGFDLRMLGKQQFLLFFAQATKIVVITGQAVFEQLVELGGD